MVAGLALVRRGERDEQRFAEGRTDELQADQETIGGIVPASAPMIVFTIGPYGGSGSTARRTRGASRVNSRMPRVRARFASSVARPRSSSA